MQKGYTTDTIKALLERAGMQVLLVKDADTDGEVTAESQRVYMVAKEQSKKADLEQ